MYLHTLKTKLLSELHTNMWAGKRSRYSDCLRAGRSGNRNPVGAGFSAPVQTGLEAHTSSCTMGTGSFPRVRCSRGVTLTPHPLLVRRSKIEYSYSSTLPKGFCGLWKGETYPTYKYYFGYKIGTVAEFFRIKSVISCHMVLCCTNSRSATAHYYIVAVWTTSTPPPLS
jgi:hypothetical protein